MGRQWAERARRDVCLRATDPGRGDRQPGLPEYLSRLGHNAGQATKKGVFAVLHPTLQQHPRMQLDARDKKYSFAFHRE